MDAPPLIWWPILQKGITAYHDFDCAELLSQSEAA
jgi:hypothetical protein